MNERSWQIWQTDTHRFCRRAQLVDKEIIEKFAELIVRECMSFQDEAGVYSKFDMANAIARCFGVKE